MPSVSDFIQDSATVRFGDDNDPTEVAYRPSALDADRTDRFYDALVKQNDVLAAAYLLTGNGDGDELITRWNITGPVMGRRPKRDDAGEPVMDANGREVLERFEVVKTGETIPLDPEVLKFLSPTLLMGIYRQIQDDTSQTVSSFFEKATTTSSNGSRPR